MFFHFFPVHIAFLLCSVFNATERDVYIVPILWPENCVFCENLINKKPLGVEPFSVINFVFYVFVLLL